MNSFLTPFLLNVGLLALAAYFLGAWIACLVRTTFFGETAPEVSVSPRTQAAPQGLPAPIPAPERRPEPEPIRPRMETVTRPAPPMAVPTPPVVDANRFGRALLGDAAPVAPVPAVPAQAAPVVAAVTRATEIAGGALAAAAAAAASAPARTTLVPDVAKMPEKAPEAARSATSPDVSLTSREMARADVARADGVRADGARVDITPPKITVVPQPVPAPTAVTAPVAAPPKITVVPTPVPEPIVVSTPVPAPKVLAPPVLNPVVEVPPKVAVVPAPAAPVAVAPVAAPPKITVIPTATPVPVATEYVKSDAASSATTAIDAMKGIDPKPVIGQIVAPIVTVMPTAPTPVLPPVQPDGSAAMRAAAAAATAVGAGTVATVAAKAAGMLDAVRGVAEPAPAAKPVVGPSVTPAPVSATNSAPMPAPMSVLPQAQGSGTSAPMAAPQPVAVPPLAAVPTPAPIAAPSSQPASGATALDDLTRIRAITPDIQGKLRALGIKGYKDLASLDAKQLALVSSGLGLEGQVERENWIEQAQILSKGGITYYAQRKDAGEIEATKPGADQGQAIARPAAAMPRDNLQRIGGINAEVEKLLNVQGVSRYAQIGGWTPDEIARFDRLLGQDKRIARETWVEQAQILGRGGITAYARAFDSRGSEQPTSAAAAAPAQMQTTLVDAPASPSAQPRPQPTSAPLSATQAPMVAADTPRSNDLSALRSVRSEALRAGETASVAGSTVASRAAKGATIDDLKRIRGVGVLIEKKLNSMGVTSYEQVASWTTADIDRVSQYLDFRGRIERENWIDQARILASGGQTEFSRRLDRSDPPRE